MKRAPHGRVKHVPQRTCLVCRSTTSKRALTRLVRTPQGVEIDPTGKQNGRGAYLCEQPACWVKAIETDIVAKALRITLTPEDRERLRAAAPTNEAKDLAM